MKNKKPSHFTEAVFIYMDFFTYSCNFLLAALI